MKYDLDISIEEKCFRLSASTLEIGVAELAYKDLCEGAFAPSHVADYENWKMTNKRNKR